MEKKLVLIVGPTAVGKTALALEVATRFKTEIISADSRQIFKELTIGTAKPTQEELSRVPHHFINSHSIIEKYDAAQYGKAALVVIHELFESHDLAVMCGGSGLYIRAALEGFDDIPTIPDETRDYLVEKFESSGIEWLQEELRRHDPEQLNRIDNQNPARLMRALEVKLVTGHSISSFHTKKKRELPFKVIKIGLSCDRDELYQRIDSRMNDMIGLGLFEEAKSLYQYKTHRALQTVGYQEIFDYMDGKYEKEEAVRLLKRNSRRYAKRQLTWFARDEEVQWYRPGQSEDIINHILGN
jgi:tRNA dimethylallyltransferase